MDNEELKEQELQEEQEEEVEQVKEDTPQEEETPEFLLDKDGNLQWNTDEFDNLDEQDSESTEEQPEKSEEESEEETEEEPKYKVKVDGQEVEVTQEELLRGYMRQSDYTRKTQALANERQRYEQQQQWVHQPVSPHPPVNPTEQQQQAENLNDIAKQIAARQLGLESPEDLSELDFDHITAVIEAKQALVNQRNAMFYRQQNIDNLEAQLRSEEPKYDDIMQNINDAMQNMPVNQFNKLKQAYAEGNPEPLRDFFKKMQKDYYSKAIQKVEQKKNKPVPKVVPSGNTSVEKSNQKKKIDFRKLGSMTTDQKAKMLLDLGFVD